MKPHKFKVLISSGLLRSEQHHWDWGLFSWVQRGWESEREELHAAERKRVGGINIENSDKEVIISTQSIFYPVGLLGGWRWVKSAQTSLSLSLSPSFSLCIYPLLILSPPHLHVRPALARCPAPSFSTIHGNFNVSLIHANSWWMGRCSMQYIQNEAMGFN